MGYHAEEGEFRVAIPEEYQGKLMSQILPNSIFEIFVTSFTEDQSFVYGQGMDLPANYAIQSFYQEVGTSDVISAG